MQDCCRAEHCRFEMAQEVSLGATDFQNRPDVRARIESARAQMSGNAVKKDVPGWIDPGGSKRVWDLVPCDVRLMIRLEKPVEPNGIAVAQIGKHSHCELEPECGRQLLVPDETYESLPGGQRERTAKSPSCPPAHPP